jgi:predicted NBD/HSP70 family sugar kinase
MSYVLFDIGGTKTRVAVSEDLKTFSEPKKFATSPTMKAGVKDIFAAVAEMTDKPIRGVAGGIRGALNHDKTEMVHDPGGALTGWEEEPLVKELQKGFGGSIYLENDAALVGMGETHFGAGESEPIVVYLTVSTGVGGAKIEHGQVDEYRYGFEPGHQILDVDHTILGDDEEPTLENLVSGSAIERRFGTPPYEIPQSDKVWDQLAYYLAHGLRNTILYWSPDVIVLGGSMIVGDPRIMLNDIIRHTDAVLAGVVPLPAIVDAKLGDVGGLYGAMALLQQKV